MGAQTSKVKTSPSDKHLRKSGSLPPSLIKRGSAKKRDEGRLNGRCESPRIETEQRKPAPATTAQAKPANGRNNAPKEKNIETRKLSTRRTVTNVTTAPKAIPPLRDHNRVSENTSKVDEVGESKGRAGPAPQPVIQPPANPQALSALRHASAGVEALAVLVNYLTNTLDAFSMPKLKSDLDKMRTVWIKTKLELEETEATCTRLKETLHLEKQEHEKLMTESRANWESEQKQLKNNHKIEIDNLNKYYHQKIEQMELDFCEKEKEMLRCNQEAVEFQRQVHQSEVHALKQEHMAQLEDCRQQLTSKLQEALLREEELTKVVERMKLENGELKDKIHLYVDALNNVKDTKGALQKIGQLESEVSSLRSVLEIRTNELHEHRKQSQLWQRDAEELPQALQKITTLTARLEDLQAQLEQKELAEQQLVSENRKLADSVAQEAKQKKRLSMHNEELQWKLKQNADVANALVALYGDGNSSLAMRLQKSPKSVKRLSMNADNRKSNMDTSETKSQPGDLCQFEDLLQGSPPTSPKVKAMVEKADSVAWVLDMDEPPVYVASRILRRAHSMKATSSPSATPKHQSRSLPNHHKQRTRSSKSLSVSSPTKTSSDQIGAITGDLDIDHISEEVILVKSIGNKNVLELLGFEDDSEIHIEAPQLKSNVLESRKASKMEKTKSDEELQMIRRVEESGLRDEITLPKDSAGEAMISEETSDDEIVSEEDESASEDVLIEADIEICNDEAKLIKLDAKLPQHSLGVMPPLSDSGSLSNTAMDLSWSEDAEILPSEG